MKKRYNQFNSHLMAECIDGDYVLFSEAVEIEQERDQLKARVEELEQEIKDLRRGFLYLCRDDQVETLWGERPEDIMELCIEQSIDDPKNKRSRT